MPLSTWRTLGLSVAASYTIFGSYLLSSPTHAGHLLGIRSPSGAVHHSNPSAPVADPVVPAMRLLGARDLSLAVALFMFDYHQKPVSMGMLISSSVVLCLADFWWVARAKGRRLAAVFGAAGVGFAGVGWGLVSGAGGWEW
ncbi:MAG: hypothetical protein MMC23_003286 [Stictis urceolatum]|nr:hypothetical protein [Stictis urceolata]